MDLNSRRKEIREKVFPKAGVIIVTILGIIGALMVYFSGIFNVNNLNMLYECISKAGLLIIVGGFFFIIFLYCILLFFFNIIIKPKKEILYLYKNVDNKVFFVNKKGKKFDYDIDKNSMKENCYYNVLKTHNYIYFVIEKTTESWIPKYKKSYWLNFYSPVGTWEDIFLLPIVYIIFLPGFLSFLMTKGLAKIGVGIITCSVPGFLIIYDLIYKIKLNKDDNFKPDNTNLLKCFDILKKILSIAFSCALSFVLIKIFLGFSDLMSKIILAPFLGCGLCSLGLLLSKIFKNYQLEKIFLKGIIIIFLIYWFGFLLFITIGVVKQKKKTFLLFLIPFWTAGFFIIYTYLIKKSGK